METHKVFLLIITGFTLYLARSWFQTPRIRDALGEEYDYVIVGAGSAGCVLANRLSEDDDVTVAILEAGKDDKKTQLSPDYMPNYWNLQLTDADWQYKSEPQNQACYGMKNRQSMWPRGKLLGGSSSINGMMYIRGSPHDYNYWAEELGCEGWSYADVLPYFIKAENNHLDDSIRKSGYRGTSGPLDVSGSSATPIITEAWVRAGDEVGLPHGDLNGKDQIGLMPDQKTQRNGVRASTANAYLRPAMERNNLHVIVNSMATKIIFNGKTVLGIEYYKDGQYHKVKARKEVLISAGAVNSPQLLMLSGIGPKKHLKDLQIPVINDLPVGEILQDHIFSDPLAYTLDADGIVQKRFFSWKSKFEYYLYGTGMHASVGAEGTGFSRSKYQPSEHKFPYIQWIMFSCLIGHDDTDMQSRLGITDETYQALNGEHYNVEGITPTVKLLHLKNHGYIKLRSADPFDPPVIQPNYLADQQDVNILRDAIRIGQKIMNATSFKALNAKPRVRVLPGCKKHTYDSDAYWDCFIRHQTYTVYHPTTTCKMGPDDDPTAVVDTKLRVKGIHNLRVIDASVMPEITSGNTNAPTIMIAEKAADLIKAARRQKTQKQKAKSGHTEL